MLNFLLAAGLPSFLAVGAPGLAGPVAVVPFEFSRNKIVIPVTVNGTTVRMVFDTGSPPTVLLGLERITALGLERTGSVPIGGGGGGSRATATITTGARLSVGGLEWDEPMLVAIPLDTVFARYSGSWYDGIIGRSVLSRWVVEIDFEARELRLHEPTSFTFQGQGVEIPIWFENGHPHIRGTVRVGDEPAREIELVVDTGAGTALAVSRQAAPEVPLPSRVVRDQIGRGILGPVTGLVGRSSEVTLGKIRVREVVTAFPDPGMGVTPGADGNLGADFLKRFAVTLDYSRQRLYLRKTAAAERPFTWHGSGLRLLVELPDLRAVAVGEVEPGSGGARAGVETGDRVVSVDGRSAADLGLAGVEDALRAPPGVSGRVVRLIVERQGRRLERNITLSVAF